MKSLKKTDVLIILSLFLALSGSAEAAVNISNSPSTVSTSPRIAADSNGNLHVIWVELASSSAGNLFYSRGNRDATSWTTPLNLSNSGSVYCSTLMMCGIDVDASNRIYVIYVDGATIKLRIFASGSWDSPLTLATGQVFDAPKIAVTPGGDIFCIWWASSTYRIYSRARIGGAWEDVREISGGGCKFPHIAVGTNLVGAAWAEKNAALDIYQGVYMQRGKGFNAPWTNFQSIAPSGQSQKHHMLQFDSSDIVHAIWTTEDAGGGRIVHYSFGWGSGFSSPEAISPLELLHYPNMAKANNNFYACWQVGAYGNGSSVDYNIRNQGTWQGRREVPSSSGSSYCDIAVTPQEDMIYFVWDTFINTAGDIYIHAMTTQAAIIKPIVSGAVRTPDGSGLAGVSMSGLPASPLTSAFGTYSDVVFPGWSGTVTPQKAGYTFSPSSRSYTNLKSDQPNQDFTAATGGSVYQVAPTVHYFAITGGQGTVSVTATGGGAWSAFSSVTWISITSGSSGAGNGTVQFTVSSNAGNPARTGTMTVAGQIVTVHQDGDVAIATDFNRDGKEDILWRYYGEGSNLVWYLSAATGIQGEPAKSGGEWNIKSVGTNLSGVDAPVFKHPWEVFGLSEPKADQGWIIGIMAGRPQAVTTMKTPSGEGISKGELVRSLAISVIGSDWLPKVSDTNWEIGGTGDFNQDGNIDILWRYRRGSGNNMIWYMTGLSIQGYAVLPSIADLNWEAESVADFNGDRKPDILWRYYGGSGSNLIWYMDGSTIIGYGWLPSVPDANWKISGVADFNGDAKLDILWRYQGGDGSNVVWYMDGVQIIGYGWLPAASDFHWEIGGTGDFNRDGKPDILWRYYAGTGANLIWYMNGVTIVGYDWLPSASDVNWRMHNH